MPIRSSRTLQAQPPRLVGRVSHRLLKSGGLVVLTTRERGFIEYCESLRKASDKLAAFACGAVNSFRNPTQWLAAYDRGEFCHHPTGGGGVLAESFYGETCIPKQYVETHWADRFSWSTSSTTARGATRT